MAIGIGQLPFQIPVSFPCLPASQWARRQSSSRYAYFFRLLSSWRALVPGKKGNWGRKASARCCLPVWALYGRLSRVAAVSELKRLLNAPTDDTRAFESEASPLLAATPVHRPPSSTDLAPRAAAAPICCPSNCQGRECLNARALMHKLAAESTVLKERVKDVTQAEAHSSDQGRLYRRPSLSPDRQDQVDSMRRKQHLLEEREHSPYSRHHQHGYSGLPHPGSTSEETPRLIYHGSEMNTVGTSPHRTASSPGSAFMPPQSPMPGPQPLRSILHSPSSLQFTKAPTLLPSMCPSAAGQTCAQSAHLQDLQHQISVKTVALQTLQREYDSLLQRLERQRSKCAALERKFKVSEAEMHSLADEKEKLHAHVATLECQVEDLQQSRDEARRQLVANGAQYMQIMDMANRLQGQSAEDKKKWDAEKSDLEHRIRVLQEAMVTGTRRALLLEADQNTGATSPGGASVVVPPSVSTCEKTMDDDGGGAEVARLRTQIQRLETSLQAMRRESMSVQAAARQLILSSGRMEECARDALEAGDG
ncbi:hypothetical protein ACEQ8H_002550 [Pleosporales sp. CAS-2024a]